jgi:hypothetical protein
MNDAVDPAGGLPNGSVIDHLTPLSGNGTMHLRRTKDAETSDCNPDQFGRILKSDQTGRSFDPASCFKILPLSAALGSKAVERA